MEQLSRDARFWDRAARKYAADPIKDMAGYERSLARTRAHLHSADAVLELGCGTGTTALSLAGFVRRIVATDISAEMIAIARGKAVAAGITNVEFDTGTPESGTWPDGSFDAVLALNLLHLLGDRQAALARIHRLLKPDGLLISKTACLKEMTRLIRLAVPVMQRLGRAPHVDYFTGAELERDIEAAGFAIVESARHGSGRKDPRVYIVARARG